MLQIAIGGIHPYNCSCLGNSEANHRLSLSLGSERPYTDASMLNLLHYCFDE